MTEKKPFETKAPGARPAQSAEQEQEQEQKTKKLIEEKINVLKSATNSRYGILNLHKVAQTLYRSIYELDNIGQSIEELRITDNEKFPDRTKFIRSAVPISDVRPTEEEFIKTVMKAMRREVNFNECIYDGATEQVEKMMERGPVRIWTAGDVKRGIPEHNLPASKEQIYKTTLVTTPIRNKFAKSKTSDRDEYMAKRKNFLQVYTSERKIDLVENICQEFFEKNITTIVAMEDQAKKLHELIAEIQNNGEFKVIPIWIRQGSHKDVFSEGKTEEDTIEQLNAIDSIKNLEDKWKTLVSDDENVGFICDWDGVISDDKKRQEIQAHAVFEAMKRNGWI